MRIEPSATNGPTATSRLTPSLSDRVEQELEDTRVRMAQLSPSQQAEQRAYSAQVIADIERVEQNVPALGGLPCLPSRPTGKWSADIVLAKLNGRELENFIDLKPEQRTQFVQLLNAYPENTTNIPQDLLLLLRSGKLIAKDLKGGTLLASLAKLSTQKLAMGLQRQTVLKELVERILAPEKISQRNRGTCTVTSLEYILASRQPAEFARLVTGLVSQEGDVTLADDSTLERHEGSLAEDHSGRANIDRLFQTSMMEYANGFLRNYNNQSDLHESLDGVGKSSGLDKDELNRAVDGVFNQDYDALDYRDGPVGRISTIARLQKAIADGHPILVAMRWSNDINGMPTSHQLALTAVSSDCVELWNPWGDAETGQGSPPRTVDLSKGPGHIQMSADDFFARMFSVQLPPGY